MYDDGECDVLLIAEKYFMNVTCFLLFNVCSMLGSLIAAFIELVILYSVVTCAP